MTECQDAINVAHPFGLKLWKPALYKKVGTIQIKAEDDYRGGQAHDLIFLVLHPTSTNGEVSDSVAKRAFGFTSCPQPNPQEKNLFHGIGSQLHTSNRVIDLVDTQSLRRGNNCHRLMLGTHSLSLKERFLGTQATFYRLDGPQYGSPKVSRWATIVIC